MIENVLLNLHESWNENQCRRKENHTFDVTCDYSENQIAVGNAFEIFCAASESWSSHSLGINASAIKYETPSIRQLRKYIRQTIVRTSMSWWVNSSVAYFIFVCIHLHLKRVILKKSYKIPTMHTMPHNIIHLLSTWRLFAYQLACK